MVQYTYTVLFCAELMVRMVALRWRLVEKGHFRQMGRVDGKPNMMTWDPKAWYACVSKRESEMIGYKGFTIIDALHEEDLC